MNLSSNFKVCCQGTQCRNDNLWISANITSNDALSVTVKAPDACNSKSLYGIRYLWLETPCLFKQAAIYSSTDSNLPSPPYYKVF